MDGTSNIGPVAFLYFFSFNPYVERITSTSEHIFAYDK